MLSLGRQPQGLAIQKTQAPGGGDRWISLGCQPPGGKTKKQKAPEGGDRYLAWGVNSHSAATVAVAMGVSEREGGWLTATGW
jgi:hypothetical protein